MPFSEDPCSICFYIVSGFCAIMFVAFAVDVIVSLIVVLVGYALIHGFVTFFVMMSIWSSLLTLAATIVALIYFISWAVTDPDLEDGGKLKVIGFVSFVYFLGALFLGWDIMWIHAQIDVSIKKHMIFGFEIEFWLELMIVFSAIGCALLFPPELSFGFDKGQRLAGAIRWGFSYLAELIALRNFPSWKSDDQFEILGFEPCKLILIYPFATLVIRTLQFIFSMGILALTRTNVSHYAQGVRKSIDFMCASAVWMAVWFCYFRSHLEQTAGEFVSWSFVCLAIWSCCWLLKTWLVLLWTTRAVYYKFKENIQQAAIHLSYLHILTKYKEKSSSDTNGEQWQWHKIASDIETRALNSNEDKQTAPKSFLVQPIKDKLPQIALTFEALPQKEIAADVLGFLSISQKANGWVDQQEINEERLGLNQVEAKDLYSRVEKVDSSKGINDQKLQQWVVRAYMNCKELGDTILGAKEVASYLDKLLSGFIFLVIVIIWLILTKIATLNLVILITSPILATKFIFGDTIKNVFQGVVFAFFTLFLDSDDVYVIDGIQLEVKRIGIWETTFTKVGTKEKVVYQNSSLGDKVIIKQKRGLDLNDCVKYRIAMVDWSPNTLNKLKAGINEYLEQKKSDGYDPDDLLILVEDVGFKYVKIAIHFKHKAIDSQGMMLNSEGQNLLYTNRSANLLLEVKQILARPKG